MCSKKNDKKGGAVIKGKSINKEVLKAIDIIVKDRIESLHVNNIVKGRVVDVGDKNKYKVLIMGTVYTVPSLSNNAISVNSNVFVAFPTTNSNDAFILSSNTVDSNTPILSINGYSSGNIVLGINDIPNLLSELQSKININSDLKSNTVGFKINDNIANIQSGETLYDMLGKISKWYVSLSDTAWTGDAETVNGHTVESSVPLNAKFTDTNTTYSEITTAEIDAGTSSTLRTISGRRLQYIIDKVATMISTALSGLTKTSVGLGNVDNTSDLDKPISNATQTALNGKVDNSKVLTSVPASAVFTDTIYTHPTGFTNEPASALTGANVISQIRVTGEGHVDTVTTRTMTKSDLGLSSVDNTADNTKNVLSATKLTTARTINGVLFDGSANIVISDSTKEPIITAGTTSQYYRGDKSWQTLDKSTVGLGNVTNESKTTMFASPSFTGTPTAPTATTGTNTTQIATTAFVQNSLSGAGSGDMLKSIYDTNNSGIVDNAEKLNGFNSSFFSNVQLSYVQPNNQRAGDIWLKTI